MSKKINRTMMLIVNPAAGKESVSKYLARILKIFQKGGFTVSVYQTHQAGDAIRYIADHGREFDTIVCAGGDGTMSETVTGIIKAGLHTPVGYIPAGSMNDFASYHKIPKKLTDAAKAVVRFRRRPVDVISFNDEHYGINAIECGVLTSISYTTPQKRKKYLGGLAYVLEGIKDLTNVTPVVMKVTTSDGEVIDGQFIFGIICNATRAVDLIVRKKHKIQADDGLMEVGLVFMPNSMRELSHILRTVQKADLTDPCLRFFEATEITIESEHEIDWSIDGEYMSTPKQCTVKSLPGRIELLY